MKAIVIGGGISGLASAALLAQKGFQVTLLEKNASLGGRAMVWKQDGFTFDMGPSWYQVPEAFEHFFAHFNKKPTDFFELTKLNPQYKLLFGPEDSCTFSDSLEENMKLFEFYEKGSSEKISRYLEEGKNQYDISIRHILYHNFNSIFDYMNPFLLPYLMQMNIFENLESYISKFTQNERIKKMLLYTALFIGGNPKEMPALYSLMSYVDLGIGTFYSNGGIGSFISSLEQLCNENKVEIKLNEEVHKIGVENGKATSVTTNNASYQADIVLSAADYPFTELHLLEPKYQTYPEPYWKKSTISPSAFVIYLGLNKKISNLQHHNLFLAENWDDHFDSLFTNKRLPENPSYYISCPSKTDPNVAPPGCENIFITVQLPSELDLTDEQHEQYFVKIIAHLESLTGEPIREHIVLKRILCAKDYNSIYNAYGNAAIGLATTFKQSLFRPANKSSKVKNLYYAGQYTAPGAGMPMCLISAEKAVERITKENHV